MQSTLRALAIAVALLVPGTAAATETPAPKWREARPYLLEDPASRPHVRRSVALAVSSGVIGGIAGGFAATSLAFAIVQEPKNCLLSDPPRCFWTPAFTIMAGIPAAVFGGTSAALAFGSHRERRLAGDRYTGSFGVGLDPVRDEVRLHVRLGF